MELVRLDKFTNEITVTLEIKEKKKERRKRKEETIVVKMIMIMMKTIILDFFMVSARKDLFHSRGEHKIPFGHTTKSEMRKEHVNKT